MASASSRPARSSLSPGGMSMPVGAPPAMIWWRSRTIGRGAGASGSRDVSIDESLSTETIARRLDDVDARLARARELAPLHAPLRRAAAVRSAGARSSPPSRPPRRRRRRRRRRPPSGRVACGACACGACARARAAACDVVRAARSGEDRLIVVVFVVEELGAARGEIGAERVLTGDDERLVVASSSSAARGVGRAVCASTSSALTSVPSPVVGVLGVGARLGGGAALLLLAVPLARGRTRPASRGRSGWSCLPS